MTVTTLLDRVVLDSHPLARCNDGSPASYYRPLQESASPALANKKMLIYLKGGGYCVPENPLTDITVSGVGCKYSFKQRFAKIVNSSRTFV